MPTVSGATIPASIDDVTPEWLSSALAGVRPKVEVTSVSAEPLHDGTASAWRLHLECAGNGEAPSVMCLKSGLGVPHSAQLASAGLYRKEAVVYLDVLPETSARVAQCYAAGYDASGYGFMLLEDVVVAGGRFCAPVSPLTIPQVAVGLEQLAELHAGRWQADSLSDAQWLHHGLPLSEPDPLWMALFDEYDRFLQTPHGGAVAGPLRDADVVGPAFGRLRTLDDASARSLIHGDAHVGNFFLDREGNPGMADFQCVQRGSFTHDLAMFIASALDVVDRREHEHALLRHYIGHLELLGVDRPDFDEVWLGYRRHLIYALVVWLFTTDRFQPELHLVTNVFRYGMAALDLDSLAAIDEG